MAKAHKSHKKHTARHAHKKVVKSVSVAKRYAAPGSKTVARDRLHKLGKKLASGKNKGKCPIVLSKEGRKVRNMQLAKKKKTKKK